jgi:hypothetical protein
VITLLLVCGPRSCGVRDCIGITRSDTYWKLLVCLPSPYTVKGSFLSACSTVIISALRPAAAVECLAGTGSPDPRGMTHLRDEVADDPAVVDAHPRPVRVEDPGDPHLHARTNVPAAGRLIGRKVHAIGIRKDACRRTQYRTTTNLEVGCAVVVHGQRLRRALALVVAAPNTCIFLIHR